MTDVVISRRGADRVSSGHPWIFSSDVVARNEAAPGAVVRVIGPRKTVLGIAHYSSTSQITLRLLSDKSENVDSGFFRTRLEKALAYRRAVVSNTEAYRLVHGEGDLLPALILDRYNNYFAIQTLDQGMDAAKQQIVAALVALFAPAGILERNDVAVRVKEGLTETTAVLAGDVPDEVEFDMNGLRWVARLRSGQKTGFFLDQRENYLAARRYAHGAALDCFTYAGGFALHLAGVCPSVEAVDSSVEALNSGRRHSQANGLANIEFRQADVFDLLSQYAAARRQFGTVVLDPPAFAKGRMHLDRAIGAYKEINLRALKLLDTDGVLVTCSCSYHLSESQFLQVVAEAALDARRTLRVLERRTQALDHPILLTVPETHYLKCLILQVI